MMKDKGKQASEGSSSMGLPKPMDRAFPSYENSESVPEDDFCETPLDQDFENPGDLSKRFGA